MSNKIVALAIALVVVLSGIIILVPNDDVTWDSLKENDPTAYERARAVSSNENVSIEDAANFTLYKCGLSDDIAGKTQDDRRYMISYSGVLDDIDKSYSEQAKKSDLNLMQNNASGLKEAYSNGTPYFNNGEALPIFSYTSGTSSDYSNATSSIIRYCVYVETDYDTDSDGKRDLVKVLLQVPRAAVTGCYKAPVILECDPYGVGGIPDEIVLSIEAADSYDLSKLYSEPAARVPAGSIDPMTLALSAKTTDWTSGEFKYSTMEVYDYYLVRGYAVAICCGLGTYGSEGFVCTGTDIELSSYRNVIEWFDGKATAFSDKTGCVTTKAEWSNGNVGTTGQSYLGTIQIGLATLGIPNLKTVNPIAAISNWYEYACCQGAYNNFPSPYLYSLNGYVSSRYLTEGFSDEYIDYIAKLKYDESLTEGNYLSGDSDFWTSRDYRNNELHPGTAILFLEGLNELNVRTKQFDMAYDMFTEAGYTVKAYLHQGLHQGMSGVTAFDDGKMRMGSMDVNGEGFYNFMNRWFSHYLFDIDNDVTEISNICVQSNIDGSWSYMDSLDPTSTLTLCSSSTVTNTISKDDFDADPVFRTTSDSGRSAVSFNVDRTITITGVPKVTIRASTSDVVDNAVMTVALYDVCESGMSTYVNVSETSHCNMARSTGDVTWTGSGLKDYDIVSYYATNCTHQLIATSIIDMNNPSSNYESRTAVPETIEEDTYYEYDLYLNPTVYTIEEGHTLVAVVYTYDPNNFDYGGMEAEDYSLTIDESSIKVSLGLI